MKAGHATPGTNTALSDCLSGEDVHAPSSALQCTQRQQPRRERDNLHTRLLFFPSACQSGAICTIGEGDVRVCRYCTCDSPSEYNMQIWTHILFLSSPFQLNFFSSACLAVNVDLCEFSPLSVSASHLAIC